MSDGLSDAHHEAQAAHKLERAIHILEEALTEFWDPIFGLHRQAEQMVADAIDRIRKGRRKCWEDCYDLQGHRRRREAKKQLDDEKRQVEYQSAWRSELEKALRNIDPDIADHAKLRAEEWLKENGKYQ